MDKENVVLSSGMTLAWLQKKKKKKMWYLYTMEHYLAI